MVSKLVWGTVVFNLSWWLQAVKDLQTGSRVLYVICAEGKANKNITIANLVSNFWLLQLLWSHPCTGHLLVWEVACGCNILVRSNRIYTLTTHGVGLL